MHMKYKNLNLKYSLVNIAYMMLVSATLGYAYNFLSQTGFADGTAGIVIALVSGCGILGQTVAGSFIDKSEKMDEKGFMSLSMIATMILAALLLFFRNANILTALLVVVCFTGAGIGAPFLNSMAFAYEQDGQKINYGLGRGIGSAAYAVGSAVLGSLWALMGRDILPVFVIVLAAITLLCLRLMPTAPKVVKEDGEDVSQLSYGEFFRKYQKIIMIVVASVCLYFCHMLVETYLAKVITNIIGPEAASVGGAVEGIQGRALFIQAMVELPTMFAFALLLKKFSVNQLMVIASVFYSIKHLLVFLCGSVGMLYGVMVLQMLSYALLVPASVYFTNENVAPEDRNKGQAVMGVTITVGGLLASAVGGQLFRFMSTSSVILLGVIVSFIGTALMIVGIHNCEKK